MRWYFWKMPHFSTQHCQQKGVWAGLSPAPCHWAQLGSCQHLGTCITQQWIAGGGCSPLTLSALPQLLAVLCYWKTNKQIYKQKKKTTPKNKQTNKKHHHHHQKDVHWCWPKNPFRDDQVGGHPRLFFNMYFLLWLVLRSAAQVFCTQRERKTHLSLWNCCMNRRMTLRARKYKVRNIKRADRGSN